MAEEEEQAGPSTEPRSGVKLFLGGLSWETDEEKIRSYFQQYGEVDEVIVMRDAVSRRPRGFGFITFKEPAVAETVCRQQHYLDGRQIDAKRSVPPEQKPKSKKIFVGGLAPETTEGQFREYFEQYGSIADAQIMQDHVSGRSRGFGFITFEDDSAVDKVFQVGSHHELANKRVEVKHATPRGSGPMGGRGPGPPGRGLGRGPYPGRGPAFEGELDAGHAGMGYPWSWAGYQPGMLGYQAVYQPPYGYGNMMVSPYGYGYQPIQSGYPLPHSGSFDPRQQAMPYQMNPAGRGYPAIAARPLQQAQQQQQAQQRPAQQPSQQQRPQQ